MATTVKEAIDPRTGQYAKIPGSLNTRDLQREFFSNVRPVGALGSPGSYLEGIPIKTLPGQNRDLSFGEGTNIQQQPQQTVDPLISFNEAIGNLLKQAQGMGGDQDLLKQRNALVDARFNARTDVMPEDLRFLTPEQQSAIRNKEVRGVETQLAGVDTALQERKRESAQALNTLEAVRGFMKEAQTAELKQREQSTKFVDNLVASGNSGILADMNPEELADLEKKSGYPKGTLLRLSKVAGTKDRQQIIDIAQKYPDAGISSTDSLEVANQKVTKNSKIYQQQIRPPVSAGGGGGGFEITKFKTDLDAIIGNTLATIQSRFGQTTFSQTIARARNDADKIATVASVVLKNQPAEIKRDYSNQTVAIKNLDKAITLIDQGVKTGILRSGAQYAYNVAGRDFDPKLTAINQHLISAIQPYRNSITGAAWGEQEDAEYVQLFGSIKYSPAELKDRLVRVREIMKDKSVSSLNAFVNPLDTYANPFGQPQAGEQSQTVEYPKGSGKRYSVDAQGNMSPL